MSDEPVNIVRFRNGKISPIGDSKLTVTDGTFDHSIRTSSGLVVRSADGSEIAKINEKTGTITLSGSAYRIGVNGASVDHPMQIKILQGTNLLYTQSVALGSVGKIEPVSNITDATLKAKGGVGVQLENTLRFVRNTDASPTLPGGALVTDATKKGIFGIAKDGNVYLIEPGLKLEYQTE